MIVEKIANKPSLCIYTNNEANGEIFHFSDEMACDTATEICEELAENEYSDNDVCDGNVGNTPCLFLFEDCTSNTAQVFFFDNERDLRTAYEMACRFLELKEEDDGEDETADEIDAANKLQDAYDDARHVYDAAIAQGCSEQEANKKASRVLDEQLN